MIRSSNSRTLAVAALLAAAALPRPAAAHAHLTESQPAEGATAASVPDLRLLYTEALDLDRSTIAVRFSAGQAVPLPALAADPVEPRAVLLHLAQPLTPGAYIVEWHAVTARNGQQTEGTYAFNVGPAAAQAADAAAVRAVQPWARATAPQQKVGGAYVTLTSPAGDRLLGASSPVAGKAGLHEMRMDGNVMRMRELADGLPLPAGQAVALAPGGYHIMLMDLKQPLVAGQVIPVQLRFQNAPPLDLQVTVAPVGAGGPPGKGDHSPSHGSEHGPDHGGMTGHVQ